MLPTVSDGRRAVGGYLELHLPPVLTDTESKASVMPGMISLWELGTCQYGEARLATATQYLLYLLL